MFPLNKNINDKITPAPVLDDRPDFVDDPVMPKTKRFRSKAIHDRTVTTQVRQIKYNEQKQRYDAAVRAAEADEEMQQVQLAKEQAARDLAKQRRKAVKLCKNYREQFDDIRRRNKEEENEAFEYKAYLARENSVREREDAA
jgi:hypothetical protein